MKLGLLPLFTVNAALENPEGFQAGGLSFFSTALLAELTAFLGERLPHVNCSVHAKLPELVRLSPDIILIWCTSVEFGQVGAWAENLKAVLDCPIWLAGPHISHLPQSLPENVDLGILGEVEMPVYQLLSLAEKAGGASFLTPQLYRKVSGVIYQSRGRMYSGSPAQEIADLRALPVPDLAAFKHVPEYLNMSIRTSRMNDSMLAQLAYPPTRKPRLYSPDYICQNMTAIVQQYKHYLANYPMPPQVFRQFCPIFITDYQFVLQKKRLTQVIQKMRALYLHQVCFLIVQIPVQSVTDELLRLLKSVNLQKVMLTFGPFGHDEPLLPACSPDDLTRALKLCQKYRIGVMGHAFLNPSPGTTRQHIFKLYTYLKEHVSLFETLHCSVLGAIPGLKLWDTYVERNKRQLPKWQHFPWHALAWDTFDKTMPLAQKGLTPQLMQEVTDACFGLGYRAAPFVAPLEQSLRPETEAYHVKNFAETYLYPEARLLELVLDNTLALKPYLSDYHEVSQLRVENGKVKGIPPKEPVDVFVSSASLHALRDPKASLISALKSLRLGGMAYFTVLNPMCMGHIAQVLNWPGRQSVVGYEVLKWFTDTTLAKMLMECGLSVQDVNYLRIEHVDALRPTIETLAKQFEHFGSMHIPQHALYIREINIIARKETHV